MLEPTWVSENGHVALYRGDCLEVLPHLTERVDGIITDLPYGTTACDWDAVIPFAPMWVQIKRLLLKRGAFVTTATQPFTSALVMSNPGWFKYEWAWDKNTSTCFVHAKHRPLGAHEDIVVFGDGAVTYNPQKTPGKPYRRGFVNNSGVETCPTKAGKEIMDENITGDRYPKTVLRIDGNNRINLEHPTQKPVPLYSYLVRTYTNKGGTVLDFAMGVGTTGLACVETGRRFIGIERDVSYFEKARRKIEGALAMLGTEGIWCT